MSKVTTLGIDLAKNVFQLHGTDAEGKTVLKKRLSREKIIEFVAKMPTCLIGIEAYGGAHYWARTFQNMGHTVNMMSPQFVKPYIKSNKNDVNDAAGIAEAVTRPDMKFVAIKKIEQQDTLLLHRARELCMKQRTAQANQLRGLLLEYGVIIPQGIHHLKNLPTILEENKDKLTVRSCALFKQLYEQFKLSSTQVEDYTQQIERIAKDDAACQKIMQIEGIGPLTASAVVATIGDVTVFKNGRELSAWLGLVPKQHSSGNKIRLSGISKRGDRYLRTLLVHGARSVVNRSGGKKDRRSEWISDKKFRCGYNKASVALANKNARVIWGVLAKNVPYEKSSIPLAKAA